jgi:hypothetical protein
MTIQTSLTRGRFFGTGPSFFLATIAPGRALRTRNACLSKTLNKDMKILKELT